METHSNVIFTLGREQIDVFECHPFTNDFYRTASGRDIPGYNCFHARAIPNTFLIVFCAHSETTSTTRQLVVYDLKKSLELVRQNLEVDAIEGLKCSRNVILLTGTKHNVTTTTLYSWKGSEIVIKRTIVPNGSAHFLILSASGVLAYHSSRDDTKIDLIDCGLMGTNGQVDSSKNGAESPRNAAASSRNGAESSSSGAESSRNQGDRHLKRQRINKFPDPESIKIDRREDPTAISSDGQLLTTMWKPDATRRLLTVYNTRTKRAVFALDTSFYHIFKWQQVKFSDDNRFLVLPSKKDGRIFDLHRNRLLTFPWPQNHSVFIRNICGVYYLYIFCRDGKFEVKTIDLESECWQSIDSSLPIEQQNTVGI